MHRREVLKGLTLTFGLAGTLIWPARWTEVTTSTVEIAEIQRHVRRALTAIFRAELRPEAIGHRYLSLHPEEADIDRLWTVLFGLSAPSRLDELKLHLAQLRQQDFECGEIAIVDGWILARTEARACALVAII